MSSLEQVKKFLETVKDENIIFKDHFHERVAERPISEELVRKCIKNTERLLKVEEQPARTVSEEKYKIWIKLSNRYDLVIVITISNKVLYIITGWNTNRRWQKAIQK